MKNKALLNTFDIQSTNACKGVALIFLLWHHLFITHPEYGLPVYLLAILSKVCVAIFVILSGYGLSESIKSKKTGLFKFYKKRLATIYLNYWLIALIFVPIGIYGMNRTLQDAFTNQIYLRFIIQLLGFHRFIYAEYGYNATWWYMSVIIPLIILFPFINDLTKKYGLFFLFLLIVILIPKHWLFQVLNIWLFPFALGVYLSQNDYLNGAGRVLGKLRYWRFPLLAVIIAELAVIRLYSPFLHATKIDGVFGFFIILLIFEISKSFILFKKILGFLGNHLFNIFLFHTFIYFYFWPDFIYSFKSPIFIFTALLSICLLISIAIELLKRIIFYYPFLNIVIGIKIPLKLEIEL